MALRTVSTNPDDSRNAAMAYGSDIISLRTSARNWRILSWMPFGTQERTQTHPLSTSDTSAESCQYTCTFFRPSRLEEYRTISGRSYASSSKSCKDGIRPISSANSASTNATRLPSASSDSQFAPVT